MDEKMMETGLAMMANGFERLEGLRPETFAGLPTLPSHRE